MSKVNRAEVKVYMSPGDFERIRLAASEERIPVSQFMRDAALQWARFIFRDVLDHGGSGHISAQAIAEVDPALFRQLTIDQAIAQCDPTSADCLVAGEA